MESSVDLKPRAERFSFLEDLEFKKQLADAEAAALAKQSDQYNPVLLDYLVFAFFCFNVMLVGIAPMNYGGVLETWRETDTFRSDCSDADSTTLWCPTQIQLAKKALVYFHALAFTSTVMAGGIVHHFGASMAHVAGHLMFLVGCYFLQSSSARSVTLGLTLHGAAGELAVNGIAPMCSIFGKATNWFIVMLSISFELSALFYPLALHAFGAIEDMDIRKDFFPSLFSYLFILSCILTTVGTFILPVEDDGALTPYGIVAGLPTPQGFRTGRPPPRRRLLLHSHRRAVKPLGAGGPMGRFAPGIPAVTPQKVVDPIEDLGDDELERLLRDAEAEPPPLLLGDSSCQGKVDDLSSESDDDAGGLLESSKRPALRLIAVIQKPQFLMVTMIFALAAMRQSFMYTNSQQLWEVGGDLGSLHQNAKWLLLLSILFSPIGWYTIDRPQTMFYAHFFHALHIGAHACFAVPRSEFQWVATVLSIMSRSLLAPVITTLIVSYFGVNYFAGLSFLASLFSLCIVFVNIPLVDLTSMYLDNDFSIPNYVMLGTSIVSAVLCVVLSTVYPPPKAFLRREPNTAGKNKPDESNHSDSCSIDSDSSSLEGNESPSFSRKRDSRGS